MNTTQVFCYHEIQPDASQSVLTARVQLRVFAAQSAIICQKRTQTTGHRLDLAQP